MEFLRICFVFSGKVSDYDLEQIERRFNEIDEDGNEYITAEDFVLLQERRAQEAKALSAQ